MARLVCAEGSTHQFLLLPLCLVASAGPLELCSVARNFGSSFRFLLESALSPFTRTLNVICRVPASSSDGTATQALGGEETYRTFRWRGAFRLQITGGAIFRGYAPLSPRVSGKSTRMLTSPERSPSGDNGVPLIFCANSPSHLSRRH